MKQLNNFIQEKLIINKNIKSKIVKNDIDIKELKYFTKQNIDDILEFINKMPLDVRPLVISNHCLDRRLSEPDLEIYFFYDEEYLMKSLYNIPYVRIYYCNEGLSVDIYDSKRKYYYRSEEYPPNSEYLNSCFEYIESKYDIIRKII